jgi:uncharacterized phage-associated protein
VAILVDPKNGKFDPRGVANYVLDCCEIAGIGVSNLKLLKLLFFVEGWHLATLGKPLIDADFEAWQHGPVLPILYHSFKIWGSETIENRATAINLKDGSKAPVRVNLPDDSAELISFVLARYGRLSPSRLVELSHKKNGPWEQVFSAAAETRTTSRISRDAIHNHFAEELRRIEC